MSLPSNPLPEPDRGIADPSPMEYADSVLPPSLTVPLEPMPPLAPRFPAWSWWDALAVLGFTIFAVFVFSMIALGIARHLPQYRRIPLAELATNARIVVGAQAAAYPIVLVFIFLLVRSR